MTFTPEVYEQIRAGAQRSAARIVPIICDLFHPERVVDVGCGEGWFGREFAAQGCRVVALDESVGEERCESVGARGQIRFRPADLTGDAWAYALELDANRRAADVAVCLEVAEHLSPGAAEPFVATLCALAPVVVFSAAIPGQGGHGHLNEQWPDYWKDLFNGYGFQVTAALRTKLWDWALGGYVEPWYAQNLLVAMNETLFDSASAEVEELFDRPDTWPYRLVHPVIWEHRRQRP